jgi:excisionase family DNA binding protein
VRAEPGRGLTPAELARLLRVSPDRVRGWIVRGELPAVNVGSSGRPRFVVLPHHLTTFERARAAVAPARPRRRRAANGMTDFFPDL